MDSDRLLPALAAMAQPTRFGAVTALAGSEDGLTVGRLAETLGVPANTMSSHLAILARSGLVVPSKSGTMVIYRLDAAVLQQVHLAIGNLLPSS